MGKAIKQSCWGLLVLVISATLSGWLNEHWYISNVYLVPLITINIVAWIGGFVWLLYPIVNAMDS